MKKGSAYDGFAALFDATGNSNVVIKQGITTKAVVEYELVRLCQEFGDRPHRGDPLGLFPELWPFDMLKRPLLEHAREFVRQIALTGVAVIGDVDEFKVWGPYTEKVGDVREWTPEAGNHTIPKHQQRKAVRAFGYRGDEFNFDKGCAFLIQGQFTRSTKHGEISDEGMIFL